MRLSRSVARWFITGIVQTLWGLLYAACFIAPVSIPSPHAVDIFPCLLRCRVFVLQAHAQCTT